MIANAFRAALTVAALSPLSACMLVDPLEPPARATDTTAGCVDGRRVRDVCVPLKSPDCQGVWGDAGSPDAVLLGAYVDAPATALSSSPAWWPYRLAFEELRDSSALGKPLAVVVCSNLTASDTSLEHLKRLGVSSVLAFLEPDALLEAAKQSEGRLFLLNPRSGLLRTTKPEDPIWTMQGQPSDYVGIYSALMPFVEDYVRRAHKRDSEPLRVAVIRSDDPESDELARAFLPELRFNETNRAGNEEQAAYEEYELRSMETDQNERTIGALLRFSPDLVISLSDQRFAGSAGILWRLEQEWAPSVDAPLPFYVLSPVNSAEGTLSEIGAWFGSAFENAADPTPTKRFIGVGAAGPEDPELLNAYETRLLARFDAAGRGYEAFYDAFYFLTYATLGARAVDGRTTDVAGIARAMALLVQEGAAEYSVGPVDPWSEDLDSDSNEIAEIVAAVERGEPIRLLGTTGPPDFDLDSGSRIESGAVSCLTATTPPMLRQSVLRYRRQSKKLEATDGTFPCFDGFFDAR
jgi:hypothetical protein